MEKPPFQFGLKAVFAATAAAAVLMAAFHYLPLEALAYVLFQVVVIVVAGLFFWMPIFALFVLWLRICRWIAKCRHRPDA
jgi:hypothetical protein